MSLKRALGLGFLLVSAAGCGGSKAAAESPATQEPGDQAASSETKGSEEKSEAAPAATSIPEGCFKSSGICLPDPKFVKRLCDNRFPSVALYLFGNGSKWARGYLTRKTEAWNASGGASAGGYIEFDEEVLLLFERKGDAKGMQVSGAGGGYDALRWDGSCVTLSGEEVTLDKPPVAKTARIEWRFIDDNVQEALRKDEKVNEAYLERRKECKGAQTGDVSLKCVKADVKLGDAVVSFLRGGGAVPVPTSLP